MSEKKENAPVKSTINSYRKRRGRVSPVLIWVLAAVLVIGGIVVLVLAFNGGGISISLFASKDHPLARKDSVLAEDLAALRYVALAPGNNARSLAERALAEAGLVVEAPEVETDNLYQIMQYVESNSAYFAAFGPMARDFGRMSGIRRLAFAQSLPQIDVRQVVRPGRSDDPALLALSEFLFR